MAPFLPVERLSYSSVSAYLACPRKWQLGLTDQTPRPAAEPALFGSAVHAAVGQYLAARAVGQPADLGAAWRQAFGAQVERAERAGGIDWRGHSAEESFQEGCRLLVDASCLTVEHLSAVLPPRSWQASGMAAFLDTISLQLVAGRPAVERFVSMQVPEVPVPVVGFVDWIESDGIPADLKVVGWPWTEAGARLELQPAFYLAALAQLDPESNPDLRFNYVILLRGRQPRIQLIETRRSAEVLAWLFDLIRAVWRGIQAELFFPNPTYRWCRPDSCEFWAQCRGQGAGWQGGEG